jgi:hypothetical protein
MALMVAPDPYGTTPCMFFIQNQSAALNEVVGSRATMFGFPSPSKPILLPAGP